MTRARPQRSRSETFAALIADLCAWFAHAARPLPWRDAPPGRRSPWRTLVSEIMLQQTQVSRVIDRFEPFMQAFPTPTALARAPESRVLSLWAGLGYYRRARLLHRAAQTIEERHAGTMPETLDALVDLPGVGRYTAGAVASLALGHAAPIVDGNITRVILRLDGRDLTSGSDGLAYAWDRAEHLVTLAKDRAPAFNEALMELGATICTPKAPACDRCPVRNSCAAVALGKQTTIPRPKAAPRRHAIAWTIALLANPQGQILLTRRPAEGLLAGLPTPPCVEHDAAPDELARLLRLSRVALVDAGVVTRVLTHRTLKVRVCVARVPAAAARTLASRPDHAWTAPDEAGLPSALHAAARHGLAAIASEDLFSRSS